jgi:hypothetical protein
MFPSSYYNSSFYTMSFWPGSSSTTGGPGGGTVLDTVPALLRFRHQATGQKDASVQFAIQRADGQRYDFSTNGFAASPANQWGPAMAVVAYDNPFGAAQDIRNEDVYEAVLTEVGEGQFPDGRYRVIFDVGGETEYHNILVGDYIDQSSEDGPRHRPVWFDEVVEDVRLRLLGGLGLGEAQVEVSLDGLPPALATGPVVLVKPSGFRQDAGTYGGSGREVAIYKGTIEIIALDLSASDPAGRDTYRTTRATRTSAASNTLRLAERIDDVINGYQPVDASLDYLTTQPLTTVGDTRPTKIQGTAQAWSGLVVQVAANYWRRQPFTRPIDDRVAAGLLPAWPR